MYLVGSYYVSGDVGVGILCYTFIDVTGDKISSIKFVYDSYYKFKIDQQEMNSDDPNCKDYKIVPIEKEPEEWVEFFKNWIRGIDTDMIEFHGGLEPECSANLFGFETKGKENVYTFTKQELEPLKDNFSENEVFPAIIKVETSERGRMTRIEVSKPCRSL